MRGEGSQVRLWDLVLLTVALLYGLFVAISVKSGSEGATDAVAIGSGLTMAPPGTAGEDEAVRAAVAPVSEAGR